MNTHLTLFWKSNNNEEDFTDKKKVYFINEKEESRSNHQHLEEKRESYCTGRNAESK
jgi:hypothetical protein